MKRETVTAILLGLMAALPFGLLQHNWVLAICFGVLVGVGMGPQARRIDRRLKHGRLPQLAASSSGLLTQRLVRRRNNSN